jgi:hypothetical protein
LPRCAREEDSSEDKERKERKKERRGEDATPNKGRYPTSDRLRGENELALKRANLCTLEQQSREY